MLVALTVVPALGMLLLGQAPLSGRQSPLVGWIHSPLRPRGVRGRLPAVGPALALLGVCCWWVWWRCLSSARRLRRRLREGNVVIELGSPPGTSLGRMNEVSAQVVSEAEFAAGGSHGGSACGAGDRFRPDRQRQLRRDLGEHRTRRRLRRDGRCDRAAWLPSALRGPRAGFGPTPTSASPTCSVEPTTRWSSGVYGAEPRGAGRPGGECSATVGGHRWGR